MMIVGAFPNEARYSATACRNLELSPCCLGIPYTTMRFTQRLPSPLATATWRNLPEAQRDCNTVPTSSGVADSLGTTRLAAHPRRTQSPTPPGLAA